MCNEKEVYRQSIGEMCNLEWPKSKIFIQVLDYSDDLIPRTMYNKDICTYMPCSHICNCKIKLGSVNPIRQMKN
ncbi:hypothetical protein L2E82_45276 [Cichorium intybus]|uniref:Uncharacterized protein n=1 Tax=Cichorium intybus TaxID=13427 RepID=A0ACB8ZSE7_CICIN|nr:hypothetical protein L2E82_45276 [Cichorium intybus]